MVGVRRLLVLWLASSKRSGIFIVYLQGVLRAPVSGNGNVLGKWSREEKASKPAPDLACADIATQSYTIAQLHLPYLEMLCDL